MLSLNAMAQAQAELEAAMDDAMEDLRRFEEEREMEAMAEHRSLMGVGDAAGKMGQIWEKSTTATSEFWGEADEEERETEKAKGEGDEEDLEETAEKIRVLRIYSNFFFARMVLIGPVRSTGPGQVRSTASSPDFGLRSKPVQSGPVRSWTDTHP